jgi:aldose sugar dehydrogenase
MIRKVILASAACLVLCSLGVSAAQAPRAVPRPPAPPPGPPRAEDGSAAPDGYAPIPEWMGQTRAPKPAKTAAFQAETFAQGLMGAFSFNFLPDGRMIVAERPGRIKIVGRDGKVSDPITGLPSDLWAKGGQGIYEARPDKAFTSNRTLYLLYTVLPDGTNPEAPPRSAGVIVAASAKLSADDKRLEDVKVLLNAEGTSGRLIQAPDGTLLITSALPGGVGVLSVDWPQAQQLDSNMGKVLRINPDGSIPKDNPFVGRTVHPEIFALGIRDDQGVAIHPRTGKLWASEHGPRGGDEINAIVKGKNYGFPTIGYGHEYTGKPINGDKTAQEGMEQPVYFWTPDIAPAGIAFYTGKLFPAWQGDLFVASLAGRALVRLVLKDERVIGEERLLTDLNSRIRAVNEGPDAALYVMTDGNEGKILKLIPKK